MKIKIKINEGKYSGNFLWRLKLSKTANAHFFSTFHRKPSPRGMFFLSPLYPFSIYPGLRPDTWHLTNPQYFANRSPRDRNPMEATIHPPSSVSIHQYILPQISTLLHVCSKRFFPCFFISKKSFNPYSYIYISPSHITNIFLYHFLCWPQTMLNFESSLTETFLSTRFCVNNQPGKRILRKGFGWLLVARTRA